jgi:iron complex transport system ATP-binding protein
MLEYRNVSLSVSGEEIIKKANVTFKNGKLTAIIGPNGCGKTTLVQALNGVSKVTGGEILLEGQDYLALKPKERARNLSFLPQVHNVIPSISVKTLVSHGRFPYLGFSRSMGSEDRKIVNEAMGKAEVADLSGKGVDTLSGGIRQRAFIAMQLAQNCGFLVADEPTTYLDIPSQRKILDIYSALRDEGKGAILVLHDIAKALEIADEVIVMKDRQIIKTGSPEEIINSGVINEVFGVSVKRLKDENDGKDYLVVL